MQIRFENSSSHVNHYVSKMHRPLKIQSEEQMSEKHVQSSVRESVEQFLKVSCLYQCDILPFKGLSSVFTARTSI